MDAVGFCLGLWIGFELFVFWLVVIFHFDHVAMIARLASRHELTFCIRLV